MDEDPKPVTRHGDPSRCDHGAGFTLIELLVAVSLIVITMVPMTRVFWSALQAAGSTSHRTDAFAIASREIESLHANPYALIGFYTDQTPPQWKSTSTIIVGSCATSCPTPFAPLILPSGSTTPVPGNTGITYGIARYLYWGDTQGLNSSDTSTTFLQAYKAATVVVTWSDQAGSHSIEQDSIIYPGGLGIYTGPGGSTTTTTTTFPLLAPGVPTLAIAATQPASPTNQQEIDVTIVAPLLGGAPSGYYVQWSTDPMFLSPPPAQSTLLPGTSTYYAIQGLAVGTRYSIRMFALNASGQSAYTVVVSALTAVVPITTTLVITLPATTLPFTTTTTVPPTTTTVPPPTTTTPGCSLGAFTITTTTTGKTYLTKGGAMTEDIILNLNINGSCIWAVIANSVLHGTTTVDPGSPYTLSGLVSGGQWTATIHSANQTTWSVGTHDMSILVGGNTTTVTHGLLICAWKPPGQRSSSATAC